MNNQNENQVDVMVVLEFYKEKLMKEIHENAVLKAQLHTQTMKNEEILQAKNDEIQALVQRVQELERK